MKIIAIDESGDPGNKIGFGSSALFVYCFILISEDESRLIAMQLRKLSKEMYKNEEHEFHFTNETHKQRKEFLQNIKNIDMQAFVFVYNKKLNKTEKIKEYSLEKSFNHIKDIILSEEIFLKIDGVVTRMIKKEHATQIRKIAKSFKLKINKIGFYDSRINRDIQVADMIAGAVRKYTEENDPNDIELFNIIKNKITIVNI